MPETIWTPSSLQTCRIIARIRSRNATSCTLSRYFVMTNCARWRRESEPVGLRGKCCEAPVSFEHGNDRPSPEIDILLQQSSERRGLVKEAWGGSPSARDSGALRSVARCKFEPSVAVGKKAVRRFAALIIASAVAITPAQAQTASELRISGTVEKLDGNLAALSLSRGISLVARLDSEPRA